MTISLENIKVPNKAIAALLKDAQGRDLTTARRQLLFQTLWRERYLTRSQLIWRIDKQLGNHCFGVKAWEDTFYRDMRAVKTVFASAGFTLEYNRGGNRPGYHLAGEPALHQSMHRRLVGALQELDDEQCEIYGQISAEQKCYQAISMIESSRRVSRIQGEI